MEKLDAENFFVSRDPILRFKLWKVRKDSEEGGDAVDASEVRAAPRPRDRESVQLRAVPRGAVGFSRHLPRARAASGRAKDPDLGLDLGTLHSLPPRPLWCSFLRELEGSFARARANGRRHGGQEQPGRPGHVGTEREGKGQRVVCGGRPEEEGHEATAAGAQVQQCVPLAALI